MRPGDKAFSGRDIFLGKRRTVDAVARDGAYPCHLHVALPQPVLIDAVDGVEGVFTHAHSILTPAVRATLPHLAMSALMRSPSCSGVPPTATPPWASRRSF